MFNNYDNINIETDLQDLIFNRFSDAEQKTKGDEINFKICPFCHGGNNDHDKWTFYINSTTGLYECKRQSCGASGNLFTLAKAFDYKLLSIRNKGSQMPSQTKQQPNKLEQQKKLYNLPVQTPHKTDTSAIDYMWKVRKIDPFTVQKYGIYTDLLNFKSDKLEISDTKGLNINSEWVNNIKCLMMPFTDSEGIIRCIKYRCIEEEVSLKGGKEQFYGYNTQAILYGMQQATNYTKPLIITEGQMDALSVASTGISNVCSVPNGAKAFTWVQFCKKWVHKFPSIIIMGDVTEDGKITLSEIADYFSDMEVRICQVADYKGQKDANDMLRAYGENKDDIERGMQDIRDCINNAIVILPESELQGGLDLNSLKDYAELINEKTERDHQRYRSGFLSLDMALDGGFANEVYCILGATGTGKSLFCQQIAEQIADRYTEATVLYFSLEMPTKQLLYRGISRLSLAENRQISISELVGGKYESRLNDFTYTNYNAYKELTEHYISKYRNGFQIIGEEYADIQSSDNIYYTVRRYQRLHPDKKIVVFIDYLQYLRSTDSKLSEVEKLREDMKNLKRIKDVTNAPVIVISSYSRESGRFSDKSFRTDLAKGSGDIDYTAGVILNLERCTTEKKQADGTKVQIPTKQVKLSIAKNRIGRTHEQIVFDTDFAHCAYMDPLNNNFKSRQYNFIAE